LAGDELEWVANPRYPVRRELVVKNPAMYENLGLRPGIPIWQQYMDNPESVMWVPRPDRADILWQDFVP
jgi:glucose-6-phosphate isomerase